jgi:DNA-directed RNA polymerase specialized sigma24 family protein
MARRRSRRSVVQVLDEVFAAAWAACGDEEIAAEVTRRVLVARPPDPVTRAAILAARRSDAFRDLDPALVLARALELDTHEIARRLDTTPSDVNRRIARGLRTLRPRRDCAGAASPARAARGS